MARSLQLGQNEKWIQGFEGLYSVTCFGIVYSHCYNGSELKKALKGLHSGYGYLQVSLGRGHRRYIHVLVAESFLPNLGNYTVVNHKDGNKLNNNVGNLEWCTPQYNAVYSLGKAVLQCNLQGAPLRKFVSMTEAAKQTHVPRPNISSCCLGNVHTAGGFIWRYADEA